MSIVPVQRPPAHIRFTVYGERVLSRLRGTLLAGGRQFLKYFGVIDEARLSARAFEDLETDLLRFPWVEAVTIRDTRKRPHRRDANREVDVIVLIAEAPSSAMRHEVDRCVAAVKLRFGMRMKAIVVDRTQDGRWMRYGNLP